MSEAKSGDSIEISRAETHSAKHWGREQRHLEIELLMMAKQLLDRELSLLDEIEKTGTDGGNR